jgi:V8-like Glu-specific endopeptidase
MNDKDSEKQSAVVPNGVKQAEEIRGRWPWVEQSVWSERMLAALENGVKVAEAILRGSGYSV